ncbi:hypothetical protein [Ramlibacter sp.]|uniref:hypothetical protein n=1 Tax=Ramlibacter sp. TaxID=1917967 RepID=UPI002C945BF7|nr:hypothetical protein [Ramlibacter sp.]HWI81802.1 hypothetical protein [Ramlibacter sp.]
MIEAPELTLGVRPQPAVGAARGAWLFSWPLLVGLASFFYCFFHSDKLLRDGDTFWHVGAGRWMFEHGRVPDADPFSHTMPGAAWTAHEWLSEVILAAVHQAGGWTALVALTAGAFALTVVLLTRALLRWVEPVYALLFAGLAVGMAASHVLVRPHVLAMPLMMVWALGLVRAAEAGRSPSLWLLPVMAVWANLHGGFTLGLALAVAFALEASIAAWRGPRLAPTVRSWGLFVLLAAASALVTPNGVGGIRFTWQVLVESGYALQRIGEWWSPDFQTLQPLELWLLGGLAMVMHQGLRLPPLRLALLLGLLHLALKHMRYVELLGLLAPLLVAAPFAAQWRARARGAGQAPMLDRFFERLARPAGVAAMALAAALVAGVPVLVARVQPVVPPALVAPAAAVRAVQDAGIRGPVLNNYSWGGYLVYLGIPPFIDGRADMYGDAFLKQYMEALELRTSDGLERLVDRYRIGWTLLPAGTPGIALLDRLPGWRRFHTDEIAVVHVRAAMPTPQGGQP